MALHRTSSFHPSVTARCEISSNKEKTLAGCPFEPGVRAIVAKEREWLWEEERQRPPLKICSYLLMDTFKGTNL
ncbi:hypothetical protein [Paenibacillus eucommiae]|uniref:Uncharacterized protein n=1 Tax=Paenibacillus eucommiae TaxID=1355755 RepID=A0ABS4IQR5_9BACL|nr:hypothetical protein [Paenibacillus eucommiae]MBP1989916.1 hypothetical protein [Paenibacillus eucommiae]